SMSRSTICSFANESGRALLALQIVEESLQLGRNFAAPAVSDHPIVDLRHRHDAHGGAGDESLVELKQLRLAQRTLIDADLRGDCQPDHSIAHYAGENVFVQRMG